MESYHVKGFGEIFEWDYVALSLKNVRIPILGHCIPYAYSGRSDGFNWRIHFLIAEDVWRREYIPLNSGNKDDHLGYDMVDGSRGSIIERFDPKAMSDIFKKEIAIVRDAPNRENFSLLKNWQLTYLLKQGLRYESALFRLNHFYSQVF